MNISATTPFNIRLAEPATQAAPPPDVTSSKDTPKLRKVFQEFVGETFFHQLMKEMRKTVGKPAYFHGGRGEEVFQSQLDQTLVEKVSKASGKTFTEPMYKLFLLNRA